MHSSHRLTFEISQRMPLFCLTRIMLFIIRDWSISVHPLYYVVPANGHAKYDYTAGILHTIFFHRTLSLVRPKDVDCDFLEITYVSISLH